MPNSKSHQFFLGSCLGLGILFLILFFAFPVGGAIDMYFIQPWIDATGHFPLQNNWYLIEINHKLIKHIVIGFYLCIFLAWLASFKAKKLKPYRWRFGYLFWVSLFSTALIGFLKSHSAHACPWSMTQPTALAYLWDFSATQGHCFPGGHASTGFSLVTGFFVWRQTQPRMAYIFLCFGLGLGFVTGWGQMMRGAHFLSHNLWTGWIILTLNWVLYWIFYKKFSKKIIRDDSSHCTTFKNLI